MEHNTRCKRCGNCCCNIPILEHEAKKIKNYLKTRPDLIQKLFRPFDHDGCIFLLEHDNDTSECAIYNSGVRPTICKVFATKGIKKLRCPNGFVSTKYTRKEALQIIDKNMEKSNFEGTINDIMIPFIAQSMKEAIMKEIFSE